MEFKIYILLIIILLLSFLYNYSILEMNINLYNLKF